MGRSSSDKQLFRRLLLSCSDFSECEHLCAYAITLVKSCSWHNSQELREAFSAAIIVSYTRPFSGHRDTKLAKGQISLGLEENLSAGEMEMHKRLIGLRNKVFAHSVAEVRDIKISVKTINGVKLPVVTSHSPYDVFNCADLESVRSLAIRVKEFTSIQQIAVQERLPDGKY